MIDAIASGPGSDKETKLRRILGRITIGRTSVLLDRADCAVWLGISERSLDTLRDKGLPELKLGDSPRFDPDAVLTWMRERGTNG